MPPPLALSVEELGVLSEYVTRDEIREFLGNSQTDLRRPLLCGGLSVLRQLEAEEGAAKARRLRPGFNALAAIPGGSPLANPGRLAKQHLLYIRSANQGLSPGWTDFGHLGCK